MGFKYCHECGTRNEEGTKFCFHCGTKLPEIVPVPAPEAIPAPETVPEPAPEIIPEPAPEAVSEVVPEIVPEPVPKIVPEPEPEIVPEYVPESAPAYAGTPVPPGPSPSAPVKKKKKTGLVIVLIVLALLIAAAAVLLFTGRFDKIMATVKSGRGDYIGALESYENYLSRSGDDSTEAYTQASLYALSAGDADKALMYARSVPEKSAESRRLEEKAAVVMAKNAIRNENWEAAIESLRGVDSEDAEALRDEANYNLAVEAAKKGRFEEAIALLEENSYDLAADMLPEYRYRYGLSLMDEERYEEAIAQFNQTDFGDSDDMRGKCYFYMSIDYAFLTDVKEVCFDIIDEDASAESLQAAAEKLSAYTDKLFNDSELQYFGEELKYAFLGEIAAKEQAGQTAHKIYQRDLYRYYAQESECLEIIHEMYPFADEDWAKISDFFETPERWNTFITIIDKLDAAIDKIEYAKKETDTRHYIELPNDTDYTVNVTIWFSIYDENKEFINEDEVTAVLSPHKTTNVYFTTGVTSGSWQCDFRIDDFE
ncbi:MAG: zinc-ribbon domain-containing protein [Oscillospiraceae bacterium]|nr:zinc-ribbon domain-containing protein [Oscillospiraceae bacterium]